MTRQAKKRARRTAKGSKRASGTVQTAQVAYVGEAVVESRDTPPEAPLGKEIHDRRPLPPVPEAAPDRGDSGNRKGE